MTYFLESVVEQDVTYVLYGRDRRKAFEDITVPFFTDYVLL